MSKEKQTDEEQTMIINMEILTLAARREHLLEEAAEYRRIREAQAVRLLLPRRTRKEKKQRTFNQPKSSQA